MTEEGKKWMGSIAERLDDSSDILFPDHEIVLRAFCDEVDKRISETWGDNYCYEEVRDKLLGEKKDGL